MQALSDGADCCSCCTANPASGYRIAVITAPTPTRRVPMLVMICAHALMARLEIPLGSRPAGVPGSPMSLLPQRTFMRRVRSPVRVWRDVTGGALYGHGTYQWLLAEYAATRLFLPLMSLFVRSVVTFRRSKSHKASTCMFPSLAYASRWTGCSVSRAGCSVSRAGCSLSRTRCSLSRTQPPKGAGHNRTYSVLPGWQTGLICALLPADELHS